MASRIGKIEDFWHWLQEAIWLGDKNSQGTQIDSKIFSDIEQKVRAYDPQFDFDELRNALVWAQQMPPRGTPQNADDFLSDPLIIVKELVTYAQPDRETLLAAALYGAFMPIQGQGLNHHSPVHQISENFPDRIKPASATPAPDLADMMRGDSHVNWEWGGSSLLSRENQSGVGRTQETLPSLPSENSHKDTSGLVRLMYEAIHSVGVEEYGPLPKYGMDNIANTSGAESGEEDEPGLDVETLGRVIAVSYIKPSQGKAPRLARLIKNILNFRYLNLPDKLFDTEPGDPEKARRDETVRLFRLMSLWAARDPRAILIGAVQNIVNLHNAIKDKDKKLYSDEVRRRLIINAEQIYAHLVYIAGFQKASERLNDLCFQLKNPQKYQEIRKFLDERRQRITIGEVQEQVKNAIIRRLENAYGYGHDPWHHGRHFKIEFREKAPASIYMKINKKNASREPDNQLSVGDLADLFGVRVILKLPVIGIDSKHKEKLDAAERQDTMQELAQKSLEVYDILSNEFGRKCKKCTDVREDSSGRREWYSYILQRFEELALSEPRDEDEKRKEDPIRFAKEKELYPDIADQRFENYIVLPPLSGVQFVKDTMLFRNKEADKSGREAYWEAECQIIDELQHDIFMYGPKAGHVYYKTDLAYEHHVPAVVNWFRLAKAELEGRPYEGAEHIYVCAGDDEIADISHDKTLIGFIAQEAIPGDADIWVTPSIESFRVCVRPEDYANVRLTNGAAITWNRSKPAA